MGKNYAILVVVGDYQNMGVPDLSTSQMDTALMFHSLINGLKFQQECIKVLGKNGNITVKEFAMTIKTFSNMLSEEDTLLLYFSGHGRNDELVFSDMSVKLSSILAVLDQLCCKSKWVILDCCFSGDFKTTGPRILGMEDCIRSFAGHGLAITASSVADEVSRLGPGNQHSLFTGMVSTAMILEHHVKRGYLSLEDLHSDVFQMMDTWNTQHSDAMQHPIFRSCIGGTIYFKVAEYHSYVTKEIYKETEDYVLYSVKPLSAPNVKRLCAFVILKSLVNDQRLVAITKAIANSIKYENVFSSEASEKKFKNKPARAIWVYFGLDETDMIQHLYYAHTIWAGDAKMKELYFKDHANGTEKGGIFLYKNSSYDMLKKLQEPTVTRAEYITMNKELLATIVSMAEVFIFDLREVTNRTYRMEALKEKYKHWISDVKRNYLILSELDISPDDLYDWTNEIVSLAGWILDLAILMEQEIGEREIWLINHAIGHYHASLERLSELEIVDFH